MKSLPSSYKSNTLPGSLQGLRALQGWNDIIEESMRTVPLSLIQWEKILVSLLTVL